MVKPASIVDFVQNSPEMRGLLQESVKNLQSFALDETDLTPLATGPALSATSQIETIKSQFSRAMHAPTQPGGDKSYPELDTAPLLDASMHGVSEETLPDGSKGLVVNYSYQKNAALRKFEAAPFGIQLVEASTYRSLTEEERAIAEDVMGEIQAGYKIRYVETPPEEAYFSFGAYELGNSDTGKTTLGRASYPDEEGGYILIDTNTDLKRSTMLHEIMHGHGAYHTFQSDAIYKGNQHLDSYNASNMAYLNRTDRKTYDNLAPQDAEIGGNHYRTNNVEPATLMLLDHQFFSKYGVRPEQPQKQFVIDPQTPFFGTFNSRKEDSFKLQGNAYGLIDLSGGLENPSILQNRPYASEDFRHYGKKNYVSNKFFLNESPESAYIEGGAPVVVMGETKELTIEEADSHIMLSGSQPQTVDLGLGNETLILPEQGGTTIIVKDFDVYHDTLRYNESMQDIILSGDANQTQISFQNIHHPEQTSHAILPNCSVTAFEQRLPQLVKPISEAEREALMNGHRPAIEIQPGNNGVIGGYDPYFHSLQFNAPDTEIEYYRMEKDGPNTSVQFIDKYTNEPAAEFLLIGNQTPDNFQSYNKGEVIECGYAEETSDKITTLWRRDSWDKYRNSEETYKYIDRRRDAHVAFGVFQGECNILNANNEHKIAPIGREKADVRPTYIYRDGESEEPAPLILDLENNDSAELIINQFNVDRDKILVDNIEQVTLTLTDYGLALIISPEAENKDADPHYIVFGKVRGRADDIKCVRTEYAESPDIEPTEKPVPLKFTALEDLEDVKHQVILSTIAEYEPVLKERVEKYFPDVGQEREGPEQQQAAPQQPQRGSGGRGF